MKITGEQAEALEHEDEVDGIVVVQRNHDDSGRWMEHWSAVVTKDHERFWLFLYDLPLTELQEGDSYDPAEDIFLTEVFPREKTVTVYE